jgi:hypothetical protein
MRRASVVVALLLTVATSCGSDGASPDGTACPPPRRPLRIVDHPVDLPDRSLQVPLPTLDSDGNGKPDELTVTDQRLVIERSTGTLTLTGDVEVRSWADLDDDGRQDLFLGNETVRVVSGAVEDGEHDIADVGTVVAPDLTTVWPADLEGTPGADVWVARPDGRAAVYRGTDLLAGRHRRPRILPGLPRSLVELDAGAEPEAVLLRGGTITFAPRSRGALQVDLGTAHRVTWVRVTTNRIALTVDRRTALWAIPPPCN